VFFLKEISYVVLLMNKYTPHPLLVNKCFFQAKERTPDAGKDFAVKLSEACLLILDVVLLAKGFDD
jgi:hypothetical protein